MHDRSPNGSHSLPPHWPLEILMDIKEDLGGLKAGMKQSLANDHEIFGSLHQMRERVTTLEVNSRTHRSTPPPTGAAGLLTSLTGLLKALAVVLPPLGRLTAVLVWAAAALMGASNPEFVLRLAGLLK